MARLARAGILNPSKMVALPLIGKTVRPGYLMGFDERSGKYFELRKRDINLDELKELRKINDRKFKNP